MPSAKKQKTKKIEMKFNLKDLFSKGLLFILIGVLFLPYVLSIINGGKVEKVALSQFVADVRENQVQKVEVRGEELVLYYQDGSKKESRKEAGQGIVEVLRTADIDLNATELQIEDLSFSAIFWELVVSILPIILMVVLFFFLFKQMKGGSDGIMGIGKSKAKLFVKGKQNTKFSDVGGMDEAKAAMPTSCDFGDIRKNRDTQALYHSVQADLCSARLDCPGHRKLTATQGQCACRSTARRPGRGKLSMETPSGQGRARSHNGIIDAALACAVILMCAMSLGIPTSACEPRQRWQPTFAKSTRPGGVPACCIDRFSGSACSAAGTDTRGPRADYTLSQYKNNLRIYIYIYINEYSVKVSTNNLGKSWEICLIIEKLKVCPTNISNTCQLQKPGSLASCPGRGASRSHLL